jgi:hypothetical protein
MTRVRKRRRIISKTNGRISGARIIKINSNNSSTSSNKINRIPLQTKIFTGLELSKSIKIIQGEVGSSNIKNEHSKNIKMKTVHLLILVPNIKSISLRINSQGSKENINTMSIKMSKNKENKRTQIMIQIVISTNLRKIGSSLNLPQNLTSNMNRRRIVFFIN